MWITVTQEIIDAANEKVRNHVTYVATKDCPLSQALQAALGNHKLLVGFGGMVYNGSNNVVILPACARQFVRDFDDQMPVAPFSFQISEDEAALLRGTNA